MNKEVHADGPGFPVRETQHTQLRVRAVSTRLANLMELVENKPRNCHAAVPPGRGDVAASIKSVMTTETPIPPPRAVAPPERCKSTIYTEDPRVVGGACHSPHFTDEQLRLQKSR